MHIRVGTQFADKTLPRGVQNLPDERSIYIRMTT